MTIRFGIIGYPLTHSVSPVMQQAAIDYLDLDATYEIWESPPELLSTTLDWLRRTPGVYGANVTVPFKEEVFNQLDWSDPITRDVGAVNTLVVNEGRLAGYNTDVGGFIRALQQAQFNTPQLKRVLLLGAGGAARAVLCGLIKLGISHVTIANRTISRAVTLVDLAKARGVMAEATLLDYENLAVAQGASGWDLIINATSVGMKQSPTSGNLVLDPRLISHETLAFDLVYNPAMTPFLEAAADAGARTLNGLSMLIYQGAEAFTLWTRRIAPLQVMFGAAQKALS
jgi:shikimate dehydrogenase